MRNWEGLGRLQTGTAAILADSDETFEQVAPRRRDDERR